MRTLSALQNDRYLIDGCLAALQRGNDESAAANAKIAAAFEALQQVGQQALVERLVGAGRG